MTPKITPPTKNTQTPTHRPSTGKRPRRAGRRLVKTAALAAAILVLGGPIIGGPQGLAPLGLSFTAPAAAQNSFAIVAKVNDVAISNFDVAQRAALMRLQGAGDNAESEALEALVTEELQIQEAARVGLSLSQEELAQAVAERASLNRMNPDQLRQALNSQGVDFATFVRKVRADTLWGRLLARRFGERLRPTEGEIDAAMTDVELYDVRQIIVPVGQNASQSAVQRAAREAQRVKSQLTTCDRLNQLAPNYHPRSGQLRGRTPGANGRLLLAEMPEQLRDLVVTLEVGAVTDPLRSGVGFHLIMVCGVGPMSRSAISNNVMQEKAQRFSESYMEDLRRNALLEFRTQ